ncbi:MAG: hypothetical protein ACF8NJ_02565 [Phycisphaerales bacterium JB038]
MFARFTAAALLVSASPALGHSMAFLEVDNTTGNTDSFHPNFDDEGWRTFDLVVTVDPGDDWTSATVHPAGVVQPDEVHFGAFHGQGTQTDGLFFQHVAGGDSEPSPALFTAFPALEVDSFFVNPPELFDGDSANFAIGPEWTDQTLRAMWFDTPDHGDGIFTLLRLTFTGDVWVEGYLTFKQSGGDLFGYSFTSVPAPASLALLGLAGLVRRRQR